MWFNPFVKQDFHKSQLKKKKKKKSIYQVFGLWVDTNVHAAKMFVSHTQKQIYSQYCILAL